MIWLLDSNSVCGCSLKKLSNSGGKVTLWNISKVLFFINTTKLSHKIRYNMHKTENELWVFRLVPDAIIKCTDQLDRLEKLILMIHLPNLQWVARLSCSDYMLNTEEFYTTIEVQQSRLCEILLILFCACNNTLMSKFLCSATFYRQTWRFIATSVQL